MPRVENGHVIGGCRLPPPHALVHAPRLERFMLPGAIPDVAATIDWSDPALSVLEDIEGNGTYGDCVEAEDAHAIAVVTGNANTLFTYTAAMTLADYSAMTGFNASDPSTDQGTDPIAALNYRVTTGYADGSRDVGWALVDASNQALVKYAVATFGTVKMWFGVPDSIVQSPPNASGFVWDVAAGAPDQNNGHCIGSCGFNVTKVLVVGVTAQGLLVYTWGMLGIVTWAAVAAWFVPSAGGGMAVRVSRDWVSKATGSTPAGLNLAAMIAAFDTYFGGNLPAPAPPPPAPTAAPTLAAAQAAVTAAFQQAPQSDSVMTKATAADIANAALQPLWPAT